MAGPHYCKKRKTSQLEWWANLNGDLLQNIFKRLSFVDLYRVKQVCSWWNKNAEQIFKRWGACTSSSSREVPWLLFPPQEDDDYLGKGDKTARLLNLEERRFYNSFNNIVAATENFLSCNCCCVGSSYGWLVCLDESKVPFLLNPLTCKQIQLPHMGFSSLNTSGNLIMATSAWRDRFVKKAILSSYPSDRNDYYVALIYGTGSRLAFCRINGTDGSWTELDGKYAPYEDIIICNQTQLCALAHNGSLELWDIAQGCISPAKKMHISSVEIRRREEDELHILRDLYTPKYYLVESSGDLLMVIRYIGEIVNGEGEAVSEWDLLSGDGNHPLVFPYQTLDFKVLRLDNDHKMWMQVDTLGDYVIFLGGNQSISINVEDSKCKMLKRDSIYFTDDYWERMDGDYLFGGHDMGVFSLQDSSVDCFHGCHGMEKIKTPPIWVVPHPW